MRANESATELVQWGLSLDEIEQLGGRLVSFFARFHPYLRTTTRDTSQYGFCYVSGLLRMETERNMANIGRTTRVSAQNMHHFVSNSPWSGQMLIGAVQDEIKHHSEFQAGGMLLLDESPDEKAEIIARVRPASTMVVWARGDESGGRVSVAGHGPSQHLDRRRAFPAPALV